MLQRTAYENMISSAIFLGFSCFLFFAGFNAEKKKNNILPPQPPIFLKENKINHILHDSWGYPDKNLPGKENSEQWWGREKHMFIKCK